ncbi:MAG: 2-C-methyl-D-erythritol 4-phosphate cytidylyltransferase [Lentisphaerae bacterium]|nr:2-C-methyl-D-erythritol 4-phosphate cytidylyltransferase [Lentisphaerota bacterium]
MVTAIIVAAGKSERMGGGTDKAFLSLGSKPVVAWSLLAYEKNVDVDRIVLVVRKDQLTAAKAVARMFGISKLSKIVPGGARRQDSVQAGMKEVDSDTRIVVIHDGARPCVSQDVISDVIKMARRGSAAVTGNRVRDTVKIVEKGSTVSSTVDRTKYWVVQTPQAFPYSMLRKAYAAVEAERKEVFDDAQAVEIAGESVKICESDKPNIKITTPEDLQVAAAILKL